MNVLLSEERDDLRETVEIAARTNPSKPLSF